MACSDASATLLSDTTIFGFFFPIFPPVLTKKSVQNSNCASYGLDKYHNMFQIDSFTIKDLLWSIFYFFFWGGPAAGLSTGGL